MRLVWEQTKPTESPIAWKDWSCIQIMAASQADPAVRQVLEKVALLADFREHVAQLTGSPSARSEAGLARELFETCWEAGGCS